VPLVAIAAEQMLQGTPGEPGAPSALPPQASAIGGLQIQADSIAALAGQHVSLDSGAVSLAGTQGDWNIAGSVTVSNDGNEGQLQLHETQAGGDFSRLTFSTSGGSDHFSLAGDAQNNSSFNWYRRHSGVGYDAMLHDTSCVTTFGPNTGVALPITVRTVGPSGGASSRVANCASGEIAIGGGCDTGGVELRYSSAEPSPLLTGEQAATGWTCVAMNTATITAYAVCLATF